MNTGTIHIADIASQQDAVVRTFRQGLQLIEGGFKKVFDEYDDARDLEITEPASEPDPSWPNDRIQ